MVMYWGAAKSSCRQRFMVLSDRDIKAYLASGKIKITPNPDLTEQLGSCSVDFRLGTSFRIFNHSKYPFIDTRSTVPTDEMMKEISISEGEQFIMRPGEFVLATTLEHLELSDDLLGRLEGRSSLGRLGIVVHSTASVFDPGWIGKPVMELGNIGVMPVAIYPGMRICSFTFEQVSTTVDVPYRLKKKAKYVGQSAPDASRIHGDSGEKITAGPRYVKHGKKNIKI
jgi:dCTP deaminase